MLGTVGPAERGELLFEDRILVLNRAGDAAVPLPATAAVVAAAIALASVVWQHAPGQGTADRPGEDTRLADGRAVGDESTERGDRST